MSDKIFFEKQFTLKGIPKGSGNYEDFLLAKRLVQMDSKLSSQRYNELLKIAREYTRYKEPS